METTYLDDILPSYCHLLSGRENTYLTLRDTNDNIILKIPPPTNGWTLNLLKEEVINECPRNKEINFYLDTQMIGLNR